MLALLKFVQSLMGTLHSDGTPTQIAAGVALGAALGITPIANVHNVVIIALLALLNVSFAAGMLAWAVFVPIGFMFDPIFDRIGHWLLADVTALRPLWTTMDNSGLALTNFNNTVVLGSVAFWLAMFLPIYFGSRIAVLQYRAKLAHKVENSRYYQMLKASKLYNVYSWFRS
jgi:uncharacterized protein (TIGR03546 family)